MSNYLQYRYPSPSVFSKQLDEEQLLLSQYSEIQRNQKSCFYWGKILNPHIVARCLITISKIVQSNFSLNTLQLAALKDPIVTSGNNQIRIEGFSMCAGVYARTDILQRGQDGEFLESGTTNVDFNIPLVTELNKIQQKSKLVLSIGQKELGFHKEGQSFIERKVPLPKKWIKGLTSIQEFLSNSEKYFELNKLEALTLFRGIPNSKEKQDYYLTKRGAKYILSPLKKEESICIGGIHRLKLISSIIPLIEKLSFYRHPLEHCCSMVLSFNHIQFTFVLSRNHWRGFSGEGALLDSLIEDLPEDLLTVFDNYSFSNQAFGNLNVCLDNNLNFSNVKKLTAGLGAMGLLGYDLEQNHFFYRRLPFKLSRILSLNPRLKGAEKLIKEKKIELLKNENGEIEAMVEGSQGYSHFVKLDSKSEKCTCLWYSKNQGERGPCKHILATKKKVTNT